MAVGTKGSLGLGRGGAAKLEDELARLTFSELKAVDEGELGMISKRLVSRTKSSSSRGPGANERGGERAAWGEGESGKKSGNFWDSEEHFLTEVAGFCGRLAPGPHVAVLGSHLRE